MDEHLENFEELVQAPLPTDPCDIADRFYQQIKTRRSIRSFSSRPVEKALLINAIKSAGTAPSGANRQPWFFALITDPKLKEVLRVAAEKVEEEFYFEKASEEWLKDLKPFGTNSLKPYLSEAPALIAVFSRTKTEDESGQPLRTYYPIESTGLAVGILLTSLHLAGLGTLTHTPRPMGFLNESLGLDSTYKPFMIVVTGYPKDRVKVPKISRKHLHQIMEEY